MMGKRNAFLKLITDDNPDIIIIHCVIHRENLVCDEISPELNVILNFIVKLINYIKSNAKCQRIFKQFCMDNNEIFVKLLLHTKIRWLSKGNCLKRFMKLFSTLSIFLKDKNEMKYLKTIQGKAYLSYLTDIFGKLNILNKQLQGNNKTLFDSKAKICGFISLLNLWKKNIHSKNVIDFYWPSKCEIVDDVLIVIENHMEILIKEFEYRFVGLKTLKFPEWISQPFLIDPYNVDVIYQEELSQIQNDESIKIIFKTKKCMMWLCNETETKYPETTKVARNYLIPFPSSYSVECGFSTITDLLTKKRNRLDITKRGDLRLKLTNLKPEIKKLCKTDQFQMSH